MALTFSVLQMTAVFGKYFISPHPLKKALLLTRLCQVDPSTSPPWTHPYPIEGVTVIWLLYIITLFREISVFHANSVDSDQRMHSVASDLDLHCLSVFLLWETRHKWVKDK